MTGVDAMVAQRAGVLAQIALAELHLEFTEVRAPFNGGVLADGGFQRHHHAVERRAHFGKFQMQFSEGDLRQDPGALRHHGIHAGHGRAGVLAQIALAELHLEFTEVRAPFNGVVVALKTTVGQYASALKPVFTLLDIQQGEDRLQRRGVLADGGFQRHHHAVERRAHFGKFQMQFSEGDLRQDPGAAVTGVDAMVAQRAGVLAQIALAELHLEFTEVRAPFNGVVVALKTTVGQYASVERRAHFGKFQMQFSEGDLRQDPGALRHHGIHAGHGRRGLFGLQQRGLQLRPRRFLSGARPRTSAKPT